MRFLIFKLASKAVRRSFGTNWAVSLCESDEHKCSRKN